MADGVGCLPRAAEATPQVPELRASALAEVERRVGVAAGADRAQLQLLRAAVDRLLTQIDDAPFPPLDLPLLTFAALAGAPTSTATVVAAACAFVFLGADLLDDAADGEAAHTWPDTPASVVSLAGATILATLPQAVLIDVGVATGTTLELLQVLGDGLLAMSGGQQRDLTNRLGAPPSVDAVECSVTGKSGAEMAMFAALAATVATGGPRERSVCAEMGRAFGTAMQYAADLSDLLADGEQRDLRDGAWTLPLAWHAERLSGAAKTEFVALCAAARTDVRSRDSVREQVLAGGTAGMCALHIETRCQRALRHLRSLRVVDAAATEQLATLVTAPSPWHRDDLAVSS